MVTDTWHAATRSAWLCSAWPSSTAYRPAYRTWKKSWSCSAWRSTSSGGAPMVRPSCYRRRWPTGASSSMKRAAEVTWPSDRRAPSSRPHCTILTGLFRSTSLPNGSTLPALRGLAYWKTTRTWPSSWWTTRKPISPTRRWLSGMPKASGARPSTR